MKRKLLSIALLVALLASTASVTPRVEIITQADGNVDGIVVAVNEDFGSLDIMAQAEQCNSADWIYRMIYDRLLEFNRDGELTYSLATSITFSYDAETNETVDLVGAGFIGDYNPTSSTMGGLPDGWTSATDDIDWELENTVYFGAEGNGIILNIKLREDVYFSDGVLWNINRFEEMINIVKAQTLEDSLMRRQWSPLAEIEGEGYVKVINDYEGEIRLCFTEDIPFGFIDFIYSLATPMASIVHLEEETLGTGGIRIGSGAYQVNSFVVSDSVTLTPNLNWYGEELRWSESEDEVYQLSTEDITFVYCQEEDARTTMFVSDLVDITMISADMYLDNDHFQNMLEEEYQVQFLAGNPVMLTFNVSNPLIEYDDYSGEEERLVDNFNIRRSLLNILAQSWDEEMMHENGLINRANGLWSHKIESIDIENQSPIINLINRPLTIWAPNDKYKEVAYQVAYCLSQHYIQAVVIEESDTTEYDIKIDAVDVTDLNTVYNTLLGKVNTTIDNWLSLTRRAANGQTYISLHANIQEEFINQCTTRMNLGWENKVFLTQSCIHGFDLPQYEDDTVYEDFTPTGNISRVDFRWISKTVA